MSANLEDLDQYICRDGEDDPIGSRLAAAIEHHARATAALAVVLREVCDLLRGEKLKYSRCAVCGAAFELARSDAKYCSNACKTKAYRERRGQPQPA